MLSLTKLVNAFVLIKLAFSINLIQLANQKMTGKQAVLVPLVSSFLLLQPAFLVEPMIMLSDVLFVLEVNLLTALNAN